MEPIELGTKWLTGREKEVRRETQLESASWASLEAASSHRLIGQLDQFTFEGEIGSLWTSVATETCGQMMPLKRRFTVCECWI
jgi:hypothetical protein